METVIKKMYEGMFLIDSAQAASDWEGINKAITDILEKVEAEVISLQKWDERKLAYEVKGKDRGTYILVHFKLDGEKVQDIERSVQLSDKIMRVLVLNVDDKGQDYFEKETPLAKLEKNKQKEDSGITEAAEKPKEADIVEEDDKTEEAVVEIAEETKQENLQDIENGELQ